MEDIFAQRPGWIEHTQLLLDSYAHWVGTELISRSNDPDVDAKNVWKAPFVVVSHGTENDPILNYGNETALQLWELSVEAFCQTPSRKTAEPVHRDERAQHLDRTTKNGFVDDYSGIRISSTGQRFYIARATVWNLMTNTGTHSGQAATFYQWDAVP